MTENIVIRKSVVLVLTLCCTENLACANTLSTDLPEPYTGSAVLGTKENPIRAGVVTLEPFSEINT